MKNLFSKMRWSILPFDRKLNLILFLETIVFAFFILFSTTSKANKLIVVEKASRVLFLYKDGTLWKSFPCSLGWNPEQPKRREGDGATPEGFYTVWDKHPSRHYYLFLSLSYPSVTDLERAYWEGRLDKEQFFQALRETNIKKNKLKRRAKTFLGGDIGIHGGGLYRRGLHGLRRDWTFGCIALKNEDMKVVYKFADIGTPVFIYDARKPLFEILSPLVQYPYHVLAQLPQLPWEGEFLFDTPSLLIRVLIREDHNGLRRVWMWGYEPVAHRLLFWLVDYNANDRLDTMDRFQAFLPGAHYWTLEHLKALIIQNLPRWLTNRERREKLFKRSLP